MSEQIARQFHDVYERLALQFGYETREDTKVFDPQSKNGRLMIAVCAEVIGEIERERDEARAQYQTTHLLAEALAKTQVELKAERDEAREALRVMEGIK